MASAPAQWTPARLVRLREYRADPSALVASAAQFTLPDAELQVTGERQPAPESPESSSNP
ncbi:hypothetical protein Q0M94_19440 (plasmid) [Deinococcus radiomollis]|uniref:hypothetical protein n=1 Tax=Deinococcus radiomollis TaxID=468916 RepID=UPI003891D07F